MPIARKDELMLFQNQLKPSIAKKLSIEMEIEKLIKTRDTLLPKLISGKIKV